MRLNGKSIPPHSFQPPRQPDPFHKGLILLAENDPDIATMLRIYLDSLGYEILLAKKGVEVVPSCVQNRPDVVILSTNLLDRSAGGVYRKLRTNLRTKDIPVLFLSEGDKAREELEILELRKGDEIITKPFDIEDIKSYVERVIPQGPGFVRWQSD